MLIALGLCISPALAGATAVPRIITIDSFDDAEGPISAGYQQGSVFLTQCFPHVIGGRGVSLTGFATADIANGRLTCGAPSQFFLAYGGSPGFGDPQPMGLTVNPATDFLRLTFSSYNHGGGQDLSLDTYQAELYQVDFGPVFAPIATTKVTAGGAQIVDVPLNALEGTTLDFVTFSFHAPMGADFQLDSVSLVTTVPEPGAIAILGIALSLLIRTKGIARVMQNAEAGHPTL